MEFKEKLQELRKQKGLTQEELAAKIYVSRTAISKWESGRGYPNIESLKEISKFFSVTIDELLSSDQIITIAEKEQAQKTSKFRDLVFGSLDVCAILLLFLPLFAERSADFVYSVSLLTLGGIQAYLKAAYFVVIIGSLFIGILTLALQNIESVFWIRSKAKISFAFSTLSILLFILSLQPYAAVFMLSLCSIKGFMLIKH